MTVKPLTPAEKKWIADAQRLFDRCPARFDFMTIGDPDLTVLDRAGADKSDLCDGAARRDGIILGIIRTGGRVHGVSA